MRRATVLSLAFLIVLPLDALGLDSEGDAPDRIVNQRTHDRTRRLPPKIADKVDDLEKKVDHIAEIQKQLNTGQLKREDFDKDMAQTVELVTQGAAESPGSAPIQASAARAFTQAGDFSKAAADAQNALKLDPNDPVAKAMLLLSKDRAAGGSIVDGAERRMRKTLDSMALPQNPYIAEFPARGPGNKPGLRPDDDPEIARYKTEEGRAYARKVIATEKALRRQDYMTAYGLANEALTTYANNPRVLAARALSSLSLGQYRTAASDAGLVLKTTPDFPAMLGTRAASYNALGRHAEAMADAQKAISLTQGTQGWPFIERAVAREAMHDAVDGVLEDFKHAADLDPQYIGEYRAALARLRPEQPKAEAAPKPARAAALETAGKGLPAELLEGVSSLPPAAYGAAGVLAGALLAMAFMRRS